MGSDHGSVVAQLCDCSTKEERFSTWIQKSVEKLRNGEHQKSDEGRSEDLKKLPGFRSATLNLKEKSCKKTETTAAACKQVKDDAAATSEHAEGHNEATVVAGKRKK